MTKDEALKMAIEQMNVYAHIHLCEHQCQDEELLDVIQACKEALKPHPNCDEACMYQCEMERKHQQPSMTYEQGFGHGYEAHRVEQENAKQESIVSLWDALTDEQSAQEPVLLNVKTHDDKTYKVEVSAPSWQGLSNDMVRAIGEKCQEENRGILNWIDFYNAIESMLKDKNYE